MKIDRVNEIDLLRFLAAIAVVLFHYCFRGYAADHMTTMPFESGAPFAKYGFLGVQLFFMISGFVISMTAGSGDIQHFVASRISRLYPAFWACCTITFVASLAVGGALFHVGIRQYLINMTMLSEFVGFPPIDGVYWSLFVEIRFYLLVFIVLMFRQIARMQIFLAAWIVVSLLLHPFVDMPVLQYIFITDYSSYFIAGATFYLIWKNGVSAGRLLIIASCLTLGITKAIDKLVWFRAYYSTTINQYIVAAIILSFFIIMLLVSTRRTGFFLGRRWVMLGALTYPLYLIHQNIGYMAFNLMHPTLPAFILIPVVIIVCMAISYLVNRYVERRYAKKLFGVCNDVFDYVQLSVSTVFGRMK
jgi:peptidoglycan/LPS O-acetylase OafA/YrhL